MQVANPYKCRSGRRSRLSFAAAVKLRMPLEVDAQHLSMDGGKDAYEAFQEVAQALLLELPLDVNMGYGGKRERYILRIDSG